MRDKTEDEAIIQEALQIATEVQKNEKKHLEERAEILGSKFCMIRGWVIAFNKVLVGEKEALAFCKFLEKETRFKGEFAINTEDPLDTVLPTEALKTFFFLVFQSNPVTEGMTLSEAGDFIGKTFYGDSKEAIG